MVTSTWSAWATSAADMRLSASSVRDGRFQYETVPCSDIIHVAWFVPRRASRQAAGIAFEVFG
jgi:hypothetical protein